MPQPEQGVTPEELAELDREDEEGRELVRPPDVNQESNRSATRLELFFDLAFVLFIARCADLLAKDETWHGGLQFAAVLAVGWWAWASTTLYANRFDTDDAIFRLLTLLGMAGVIAMAAGADSISTSGRWFTLAYVLLRLVLVAGYLRAWRHVPDARRTIRPYLLGHVAGAAVWMVSLAVAAAVTGIHDGGWKAGVVITAGLSFLLAAALWWSYFDLSGGAAKRRLLM